MKGNRNAELSNFDPGAELIDRYLQKITTELKGTIPDNQISEIVMEVLSHIEDSRIHFESAGSSRQESASKALHLMGDPIVFKGGFKKNNLLRPLKKNEIPAAKSFASPFIAAVFLSLIPIQNLKIFESINLQSIIFLMTMGIIFFASLLCKRLLVKQLFAAFAITCLFHFISFAPLLVPGPENSTLLRSNLKEASLKVKNDKDTAIFYRKDSHWLPVTSTLSPKSKTLALNKSELKELLAQPFFIGTIRSIIETWPTMGAIAMMIAMPHLLGVFVGKGLQFNPNKTNQFESRKRVTL